MGEYTRLKLLTKCGWANDREAPLLAERVADEAVAELNKLTTELSTLKAENATLREALDTELVCCGIGTLDSMESPKHALAAIGRWHYDLGVSRVLEDE